MTELRVFSRVYYLTAAGEGGPVWRDEDWVTHKLIKCVKGDPINGYLNLPMRSGKHRRFDERTKDQLLDVVCANIARKLETLSTEPLCLVPIPNSGATVRTRRRFRTLELADRVAAGSNGRIEAIAALRWKTAHMPAHEDGPRDPALLLDNLVVTARPQKPVVIFDEVLTTGGHMVACYRRLVAEGITPFAGMVIGRATRTQQRMMMAWQEELLPVTETPFEFDEF